MTARTLLLAATLASGLGLGLGPQVVRDVRPEPHGTGSISGLVRATDGHPLRLGLVQLAGDALIASKAATTDADGRFRFVDLPAGQYALSAYRAGYMRTNYGAKVPDGPGLSLVVADGQALTDVSLTLAKYATLAGTIFDPNGEPAENISVEALAYTMRSGIRTLSSVYGSAPASDDRGIYRYPGLTAGTYFLAAAPARSWGGLDPLATGDVDRALQALVSGTFTPPRPGTRRPLVTFAPVFYPGTTDLANATPITLTTGEERGGLDVRLMLVATADLTGTIALPGGEPAPNVPIAAKVVGVPNSVDLFRAGDPGLTRSDDQGRFHYPDVPPGQYELTARVVGPGTLGPLWALTTVAVNGGDQTVSLALEPSATMTGTLVFEGTTLKAPTDLAGVRVTLAVPGFGPSGGNTTAQVKNDGTFRITGIAPGAFRLGATAPGSTPTSGWALKSAMVRGVDAADRPLDIGVGQDLEDVVITFTDHPTELAGTLQTPAGVAASDYFIIVFSTDRAQWGPQSRRTVMARPTTAGRYQTRNLPAGEYYVAAVTDVTVNEWFDPGFLDQLVPASTRVTLGDGEHRTADFKIGGT